MRILPSVLGAERRGGASCKSEALVRFRTADVIGTGRSYTASDPGPTRTASPDTAEPDPPRAASPRPAPPAADPPAPRRPGMYQWRKFEFFEEKAAGRGGGGGGSSAAVPAEIAGRVTCCSGGRGRVAVGCDDGTVGLLDRGFRLSYGFQAHASSVLFLQQLKVRGAQARSD